MPNSDFIMNEADFKIPEGWSEVSEVERAGGGAPVPSVPVDRFSSGAVSSMTLGLQTDIAGSQMGGNVPSYRVQPPQPSAIAAVNAAAQSVIIQTQVGGGSGVLFETNGIKDPDQGVQNLISGSGIALSVDSVGNKTIAATAQNSSSIPRPNSGVFFQSRAVVGSTNLQTLGDFTTATQSGNGTVVTATGPTATNGVAIGGTAGTGGGGGYVGWYPNGGANFWAGRNCRFQARVTTDNLYNTMIAGSRSIMYLGFTNGVPNDLRTLIPGGGAAGTTVAFLASAFVGSPFPANWTGFINGTGTTVDTGVAIVAGTNYDMELIMDFVANTTTFSVNGSVPVTLTGSNPTGFAFHPLVTFSTQDAITHSMTMEYMYAEQTF